MEDAPVGLLVGALLLLIVLSACFSASETGMMALNRYRLKHLAGSGHRGARIAQRLLENPDRLLGVILLGNNFANIAASSVATILALRIYGEAAIAFAAGALTIVILVFAEVAPKTLAALHPERIAFPAAYALQAMLTVLLPVVRGINWLGNGLLQMLGVPLRSSSNILSSDELRTVVQEAGGMIPASHQEMLLRILELEKITVEDIMVPRDAIEAIDIDEPWETILDQLATSHHTRLPVYHKSLDNVVGVIHLRQVLHQMRSDDFSLESLQRIIHEPYFIPEGSAITQQLLNLQARRRQLALVIDEYGDLRGLVTVEEILEEIVGEFTTQAPGVEDEIHPQDDGSYLVDGRASMRELNRRLRLNLPTEGPRTLNGQIVEYLEDIPRPGTSLLLGGYPVEILRTRGTAVSVARIQPRQAGQVDAGDGDERSHS